LTAICKVGEEQKCSFSCINTTAVNLRAVMSNQGKIYCAHCIFTGKKYIGQTVKKYLNYRITEHFADCVNYNHKFANAIKKYGRNGFIWGIVEECDISILNDREVYWIEKYDTFNNGYNTTTGGNQGREYCIKEYLVEKPNGNREEIKNLSQYCRDNDLNIAHIHETLYGKRVQHKGYKLIPRTDYEIEKYENERRIRKDTSRKRLPGERNGRAILDWNKVSEIRRLHSSKKYKNQEIADMFGIKKVTLEKIVANKLWTV
jgi:group I intron endonuclease